MNLFKKSPNFQIWTMCLAALLLILPPVAYMSSGIEYLTLSEAAATSNVFVVERVDPFLPLLKTVQLRQQPEPKDGRTAELSITYAKFRIKECLSLPNSRVLCEKKEVFASPEKGTLRLISNGDNPASKENLNLPERAGEVLWLVNKSEVRNNEVLYAYVETGVNMLPILPVMKEEIPIDSISNGTLYILFADGNPYYQAYEGFAGWGLVDISKKKEVLRLLKKRQNIPRPISPQNK